MEAFRCIQCSAPAGQLYREFPGGTIQISHCAVCGKVVDKYIECDSVLILLDALLQKVEAYRHLLFNSDSVRRLLWKLFFLLLVCDAYIKWDNLWPRQSDRPLIFDAAMEWQFYTAFLLAFIEALIFLLSAIIITSVHHLLFHRKADLHLQLRLLVQAIILSNSGKLLAFPAMVWGQTHSPQYLLLTRIFIFLSNVTAFRVVSHCHHVTAVLVLGFSALCQHAAGAWITASYLNL